MMHENKIERVEKALLCLARPNASRQQQVLAFRDLVAADEMDLMHALTNEHKATLRQVPTMPTTRAALRTLGMAIVQAMETADLQADVRVSGNNWKQELALYALSHFIKIADAMNFFRDDY
jgi:hypothetical protein